MFGRLFRRDRARRRHMHRPFTARSWRRRARPRFYADSAFPTRSTAASRWSSCTRVLVVRPAAAARRGRARRSGRRSSTSSAGHGPVAARNGRRRPRRAEAHEADRRGASTAAPRPMSAALAAAIAAALADGDRPQRLAGRRRRPARRRARRLCDRGAPAPGGQAAADAARGGRSPFPIRRPFAVQERGR